VIEFGVSLYLKMDIFPMTSALRASFWELRVDFSTVNSPR